MKTIFFITSIILFLTGCTTSSLKLTNDNELNLNYDKNRLLLSKDIQYQGMLNFKDLLVSQYKIIDSRGEVLFYEYAETSMVFEFNYEELDTVMYLFDDSQKYELVYKRDNLTFTQIQLKDGRYVNVMIEANCVQSYSFIYGFSNKEFMKIIDKVKLENANIKELKYNGVVFNDLSKSVTNWNDILVYFTPLITPYRGMGSRI
jgi:hypothetical protein